jgi:hypothetical protein
MKFSRDAEYDADRVGARIMHDTGYDPMDMSRFFDLLQSQRQSNPNAVERFFASHPSPADRSERIREASRSFGPLRASRRDAGLASAQAELRSMPAARSMGQIASGQGASDGGQAVYRGPVRVDPPSSRYRAYRQRNGFFSMSYPDSWRVYEASNGHGVTIAPRGGLVEGPGGAPAIVYGVVVNHYAPFDSAYRRGSTSLERATNDLVAQLRRSNRHLRAMASPRRQSIDGAPALSVILAGRSPVTREEERVTVVTRELDDGHVLYSLLVAPGSQYGAYSRAFDRMVASLQVNDRAVHR